MIKLYSRACVPRYLMDSLVVQSKIGTPESRDILRPKSSVFFFFFFHFSTYFHNLNQSDISKVANCESLRKLSLNSDNVTKPKGLQR
jgi:hypothetical protein